MNNSNLKSSIHKIFRLNGSDWQTLEYLDELLDSSSDPVLDSVEYLRSWIHDDALVARLVAQVEAL